jgi:hypothetical protein
VKERIFITHSRVVTLVIWSRKPSPTPNTNGAVFLITLKKLEPNHDVLKTRQHQGQVCGERFSSLPTPS